MKPKIRISTSGAKVIRPVDKAWYKENMFNAAILSCWIDFLNKANK